MFSVFPKRVHDVDDDDVNEMFCIVFYGIELQGDWLAQRAIWQIFQRRFLRYPQRK